MKVLALLLLGAPHAAMAATHIVDWSAIPVYEGGAEVWAMEGPHVLTNPPSEWINRTLTVNLGDTLTFTTSTVPSPPEGAFVPWTKYSGNDGPICNEAVFNGTAPYPCQSTHNDITRYPGNPVTGEVFTDVRSPFRFGAGYDDDGNYPGGYFCFSQWTTNGGRPGGSCEHGVHLVVHVPPTVLCNYQMCTTSTTRTTTTTDPSGTTTTTTVRSGDGESSTQSTTTTSPPTVMTGSLQFEYDSADATAILALWAATTSREKRALLRALRTGIASAIAGIDRAAVRILNIVAPGGGGRRLSISMTPNVQVDYELTIPASSSATITPQSVRDASGNMKTGINTEMNTEGLNYQASGVMTTGLPTIATTTTAAPLGGTVANSAWVERLASSVVLLSAAAFSA